MATANSDDDYLEILAWINSTLRLELSELNQACTGAVYCQMLNSVHPGVVPMNQVDFDAKSEYDMNQNFVLLLEAFEKLNVDKKLEVENLINGVPIDNLRFLRWMKRYCEGVNFVLDSSEVIIKPKRITGGKLFNVHEGCYKSNEVAIKIFNLPELLSFHREVSLLSRIHHPNIVKFIGAHAGEQILIIKEPRKGSSLGDRMKLKTEPIELTLALTYCLRISQALDYLHKHGICHNSIKPSNLYLSEDRSDIKVGWGTKMACISDDQQKREDISSLLVVLKLLVRNSDQHRHSALPQPLVKLLGDWKDQSDVCLMTRLLEKSINMLRDYKNPISVEIVANSLQLSNRFDPSAENQIPSTTVKGTNVVKLYYPPKPKGQSKV